MGNTGQGGSRVKCKGEGWGNKVQGKCAGHRRVLRAAVFGLADRSWGRAKGTEEPPVLGCMGQGHREVGAGPGE